MQAKTVVQSGKRDALTRFCSKSTIFAFNKWLFFQRLLLSFGKFCLFFGLFFGNYFGIFLSNAYSINSRNLTILSEPSTAIALTKIIRIFSRSHNVITSITFDSSQNLVEKIDEGLPSDVFISANFDAIESLRRKGLIDVYNIAYIASDELVLVTSKQNQILPPELKTSKKIDIKTAIKSINSSQNFLVIDYLGYSSGIYAGNLLGGIELKKLQIVKKLPEDRHSIARDLESDKNLFAITFASQVKNKNNLQILGTESNHIASYQAMAVAGNNMEVAREFLNFLKSETARQIMKESGYLVN